MTGFVEIGACAIARGLRGIALRAGLIQILGGDQLAFQQGLFAGIFPLRGVKAVLRAGGAGARRRDAFGARPALQFGEPGGGLIAGGLRGGGFSTFALIVKTQHHLPGRQRLAFAHLDRDDRLSDLGAEFDAVPLQRADGRQRVVVLAAARQGRHQKTGQQCAESVGTHADTCLLPLKIRPGQLSMPARW